MPAPLIIWWRCFLAIFIVGAFCLIKKVNLKVDLKKDGLTLLIAGILMGGHWVTYFYALKWSTAAIGSLALFTYPVITTLIEPLFFKVKLNPLQVGLGAVVLLGLFFLIPEFNFENEYFQGILMGVLSALLYAIRNILLKKKVAEYHASMLMFYQLVVMTVFISPILWTFKDINVLPFLLPLSLLALIPTAIGHTLFVMSLKNFSISSASIMSSSQPIWSLVLGIFILNEIPNSGTIIGGALIIATVIYESLRKK